MDFLKTAERNKFVLVEAGKPAEFMLEYSKGKTNKEKMERLVNETDWCGGTCHFEGLDAKALRTCIERNWARKGEKQNYAPSIAKMLEFLEANPSFVAHGYLVSAEREDCRISIEGVIAVKQPSELELAHYRGRFKKADEYETKMPYRAWFD